MASLYLKLRQEDGSFKEYRKDRVTARWVKEGLKHSKKIKEIGKNDDPVEVLEERLAFTCSLFSDHGLAPDDILDGLESEELFPTLDDIFNTLLGDGETEGK